MPELPEVETVKNQLEKCILNKTIIKANVYSPKLRYPITTPQSGQIISRIFRRSKYIICEIMSKDKPKFKSYWILHLGMTGFFQYIKYASEYAKLDKLKHTHADIYFEDGILRYVDARRFGAMVYTEDLNHNALKKLGAEPLEMTANGLAKYLFECSKKRKQAIKLFITNNEIIVGIGNIYACEVLFESKINPETLCSNISLEQYIIMAKNIQDILNNAIKSGGSTIDNFTHLHIYGDELDNKNIIDSKDKDNGYFQVQHKVYGKQNQKCTVCNDIISKITQGQRSTYYCPACQIKALTGANDFR